jgi:hypothetical protein
VSSGGGSFGHVGVHVGTDWTVRCNTYPGHAPILNIGAASTTVALCMAGEQPSAEFVQFARALADAAQQFAAEAERLHAEARAVERVRAGSKAASEAA